MSVNLFDSVSFTVEIGFATVSGSNRVPLGGALTDIVWTDVSAYVRDVSTKRGRNSELDDFSTGSAQVTFSNRDRRFDPEYSAGPYFGALTPGRPIRIRAAYNGGAVTNLFFGFVDSWEQQYNPPADSTAVVSASDAFKIFNLLSLPAFWDYQIASDAPKNWFKLSEGAGVATALDSQKTITGMSWVTTGGAVSVSDSSSSLLADLTDTAAKFDGTRGLSVSPQLPSPANTIPAAYKRTLELWISSTTTVNGSYGIAKFGSGELTMGVGMVVSGGVGTIKVWRGSIAGVSLVEIYTSSVVVNDGEPHHIVLPLYGGYEGPAILPKVDNVDVVYSTVQTWTAGYDTSTDTLGLPMTQLDGNTFTSAFVGVIDEVVLHSKSLTAADITAHYQIGFGTYLAGQTTSARLSTLLSMASWMSDGSDLTTGNSTVQGIDTTGKSLLSAAKECEAAEQGRFFISRDGKAKFISRQSIQTVPTYKTSQRTYGDNGSELPYTDIGFEYNDRLVANRVIVSRLGGATFTADDTVSQGQYFIRAKGLSNLITDGDRFSQDLATAQVASYKDPSLRINELTVNPRGLPASLYPAVIGDEIGTRVTVNRRPQGVGSVISKELILEGVAHRITPDSWQTTFSFSPTPVNYFILDDAVFGRLDLNVLGY